jgi:hypothetical protein
MYQSKSPIELPFNLDTHLPAIFDDDDGIVGTGRPVQPSADERHYRPVSRNPPGLLPSISTPGPFDTSIEPLDGTKRKVHDTLPPERIKQYFPGGFPPDYDGRHKPIAEDWHRNYPTAEDKFMQETFSERITQINRNFYAGTEGLVRNMEQIVRDHNYHCLENKVGVIGEERERLRGSHIERLGADGKVQPPVWSVEEVHNMNEADIAKPLLNMAFASLLSYKEGGESGGSTQDGWPRTFTEVDDEWVDSTEEGNMSFFSKPKEELLRKRKRLRKPRRGY